MLSSRPNARVARSRALPTAAQLDGRIWRQPLRHKCADLFAASPRDVESSGEPSLHQGCVDRYFNKPNAY